MINKVLILISLATIIFITVLLSFKEKKKTNFVTIKYHGELGNKLFQTATAIAYAKDNQLELILPKESFASKGLRNVLSRLNFKSLNKNIETVKEEGSPYVYTPLPQKSNCCLEGFFISEKYFHKHKKEVIKLFAITKRLKFSLQRRHPKIFNHPCTVALHIRTFSKDLTDAGKSLYEIYPPPDLEYIQKAINHFPEDALFVVCSDNIVWSKKFLKNVQRRFYFVENQKSFEDLYLMTLCDHMITSNSTFSWWAAYLNTNPCKKIIVRSPWIMKIESKIEDIIPKDWIVINSGKTPEIPEF